MGNVIALTPPLIVTKAQMEQALAILENCLIEEERASG
jgi:4-aminobutyrate aminotransferase-like enzyme